MKHELDNNEALNNPITGQPFTEEERYGFYVGLAQWNATKYQRDREHQYPKLGEQLDMLWHELKASGSISSTGDWFQAVETVKNTYPKP